ncbi:MAG: IPTL-CTERM sorting domain-containing protein, partial [Candidatus Contendobacter sp.]|nr:IPTL-CTERM sorting domain-containing protein [Candidatus Contendobacter sp.]
GGGFGGGGGGGGDGGGGGFGGGGGNGNAAGDDSHGGGGAGLGGAVFSMYGQVNAVNSTITGNSALGGGGGGSGYGGGLFNLDGAVTLTNVTLAANTVQGGSKSGLGVAGSAAGGAVYSLAYANRPDNGGPVTATLTLTNSILAGSTDGTNAVSDLVVHLDQSRNNDPGQPNSAGVIFTMNGGASTNLVQSFTATGSPTQTGTPITPYADPLLGPLANNGGPTQTLALLAGSPAINTGTNTGCPATDQRGYVRPAGAACDLGAYEYSALPPTTTLVAAPNPAVLAQTVALTATVSPNAATGTVNFQEGGSPLTCAEGAQPRPLSSSSATCTVTGGFGIGPHAFTADYSSDNGYAPSQGTTNLTVNQATTTAITSDTPDPSAVGQAIPVSFTVTPVGGGTPTGNVTVSDGTVNCIGTVAAGTCNLTPTSAGTKTLTATYGGDATFNGSVSAGEPHEVLATTAQGNAGGGTVTADITGGTCIGFANNPSPRFRPASTPLPPGVTFPYGLFEFTAVCPSNGSIILKMTYPNPLPPDTQYWKYGPTAGDPSNHWYVLPATLADNNTTFTFTITDGGLGDDDLAADGDIVDQGGPGVPGAGDGATGIPTLGEWALLLLSALFGGLLWRTRRRGG